MKNLLLGMAMIFVYTIILTLSFDTKMLVEEIEELKFITQELSATGTLFIDYEDFSEGNISFNDTEGIKAINDQIKSFMELDSDNKPLVNSYWQKKINYKVYFYDDSRICRVYENDVLVDTFNFTYPYLHEDQYISEYREFKKTIAEPTVIVSIDAGYPRFRIRYFQESMNDKKIIRTSSYIWRSYN